MLINEQPTIPAYDFPEQAGYVAPGVILMIKDMEETEHSGRDRFSAKDVEIAVCCKPKVNYTSSATAWANDMYFTRLDFPEIHEIDTLNSLAIPKQQRTSLIFLQDSYKQFILMTVKEDFERVISSKPFRQRELLRLQIFIKRILHNLNLISSIVGYIPDFVNAVSLVQEDLLSLQLLEARLFEKDISTKDECINFYDDIKQQLESTYRTLDTYVPKHKPIDFQTTDAGPGVGTSEMMVRLRMIESFLIHDLDMQMRFHYAPRDSKSHKVEQVMSSLNDACGDGRFIDIPYTSMVDAVGENTLLTMTSEDFKNKENETRNEIGESCAQQVAERYTGTRCMGTTIKARVPDKNNPYHNFFFDEIYMKSCHKASDKKLKDCPGYGYFLYLCDQFSKIYIRYNNGIEGIRPDGNFRSYIPIYRVPAPIPNLDDKVGKGTWHYHTLDTLPSKPDRESDDFSPIVQLKKMVVSVGEPDIKIDKKYVDGTVEVNDMNCTWAKIIDGLTELVDKVIGNDLYEIAKKECEKIYISLLQKCAKKLKRNNIKLDTKTITAFQTGKLKLKIQAAKLPPPLPWNGSLYVTDINSFVEMRNTCTVDNMLYFWHCLLLIRSDIKDYLLAPGCQDDAMVLLVRIHEEFQRGNFAKGKYLWFQQFDQFRGQAVVDSLGSEDEFFFCLFRNSTSTVFTSTCSNKECPKQLMIHSGSVICFSLPNSNLPGKGLQSDITAWMVNKISMPCRKCSGIGLRCNRPRQFSNGPPIVLPIDLSYCAHAITNKLVIRKTGYTFKCITYGNGGHFICTLKFGNMWYVYDGLKVYNNRPASECLKPQTTPSQPMGYHRDYAIYVRDGRV